jgi:hypothetical protein
MRRLTQEQKYFMFSERASYLLNILKQDYHLSDDDAYIWLIQSRTYAMIQDLDGLFYYAPELVLADFLHCEYDGKLKDWELKVALY